MMCFDVSLAYWAIPLPQIDVTCLATATMVSLRNSYCDRIAFNATMQSILAQA